MAKAVYTVAIADLGADDDHPYNIDIVDNEDALEELNEGEERRSFCIDPDVAKVLKKAHEKLWSNFDASKCSDVAEAEMEIDRAWVEVLRSFSIEK